MGRPPKKPADRLAEVVAVRFTKAERRGVEAAARKRGVTVAALVRMALLEKVDPSRSP